jgi:hypothetical protein
MPQWIQQILDFLEPKIDRILAAVDTPLRFVALCLILLFMLMIVFAWNGWGGQYVWFFAALFAVLALVGRWLHPYDRSLGRGLGFGNDKEPLSRKIEADQPATTIRGAKPPPEKTGRQGQKGKGRI